MELEEYIENIGGSVDRVESNPEDGLYGHYPFTLLAEDSEGHMSIVALDLGGDILACYKAFRKFVKQGSKTIFMTVDFPAGADIESDFLCVFSYVNEKLETRAIPYDNQTGVKENLIEKAATLDVIKSQLEMILAL